MQGGKEKIKKLPFSPPPRQIDGKIHTTCLREVNLTSSGGSHLFQFFFFFSFFTVWPSDRPTVTPGSSLTGPDSRRVRLPAIATTVHSIGVVGNFNVNVSN